ncbi:MAG: polysaccharide deacetylase family protein [Bryobacteraceae bacterium]
MPQIELRKQYASLLSKLRMAPCDWATPGRHCTVLNFHYFSTGTPSSYLEVSAKSIAIQLEVLRSEFRVVALKDAALSLIGRQSLSAVHPVVALSIDDGCSSFDTVLSKFERFAIPVTLFVPVGLCLPEESMDGLRSWCLRYYSGLLGGPEVAGASGSVFFEAVMSAREDELRSQLARLRDAARWPDPICGRRLFIFGDLRRLAQHPLVTVASHSMSHQVLSALPEAWCRWEVETAARYVKDAGGDVELFAYPYGHPRAFNETTRKLLSLAGIRYAFTTMATRLSAASDPFAIGRASMFEGTSSDYIRGTAGGAFELWDTLRFGRR